MIESYHRQLRKVTNGKSIFPNVEALLKSLYLATPDVLQKWTGQIHNRGQILLQLLVFLHLGGINIFAEVWEIFVETNKPHKNL